MKNFSEDIEIKAKRVNLTMAAYVKVINDHAVVGFEKEIMLKKTLIFLADNKVKTDNNGRSLIWLPNLTDSMKLCFEKGTEIKFNLKAY